MNNNNSISPKYLMKLIQEIENTLWEMFPERKYKNVYSYIKHWHKSEGEEFVDYKENFEIFKDQNNNIDLHRTLHNIDNETLIKIAIDLRVETPHFIPGVPVFRNDLKAEMPSASETFEKAFKNIEEDPNLAIGLANSALESIIKEILRDDRISSQMKKSDTLYNLTCEILRVFKLFPESKMPEEIKTIGSSLIAINQSIEKLRSEKTDFHGKTKEDHKIDDPLYAYFVVNCVATVGLFLRNYYRLKFLETHNVEENENLKKDELPF